MQEESGVKEKIRKSGYKVIYVPHDIIEDCDACMQAESVSGASINLCALSRLSKF